MPTGLEQSACYLTLEVAGAEGRWPMALDGPTNSSLSKALRSGFRRRPARPPCSRTYGSRWHAASSICTIGHSAAARRWCSTSSAGLDLPSTGVVIVVDRQAIDGPSLDRAVIFQSHALLPWRTVMGNVAYAVASKSAPLVEARHRGTCAEASSTSSGSPAPSARGRPSCPAAGQAARRHRAGARDRAEKFLLMDSQPVPARPTCSPAARCRTRSGASASPPDRPFS